MVITPFQGSDHLPSSKSPKPIRDIAESILGDLKPPKCIPLVTIKAARNEDQLRIELLKYRVSESFEGVDVLIVINILSQISKNNLPCNHSSSEGSKEG